MKRLRLPLLATLLLSGCASTSISTPIGSYRSDKDFALEGLVFEKYNDEGKLVMKGRIKSLTNNASAVNATQVDAIKAAIDRIPLPD